MPCDARSFCDLFKWKGPTQRLKTAKKSFLRPFWTPNPNFWYLIFGQFFFLFKIWACGVSRAMPCDTRSFCNLFKRKGTHSEAPNSKKVIFTVILDLNPNFLAIMSHWLGPLGLKRLRKAQTSHGKPRGPTQQLKTAEKLGFWVQNAHKIDFLAVLSLWVGSLAFERVAERPGITWHRSGHPTSILERVNFFWCFFHLIWPYCTLHRIAFWEDCAG